MSAQDLLDLAQNGGSYDEQLAAIDERLRPFAREGVALRSGDGRASSAATARSSRAPSRSGSSPRSTSPTSRTWTRCPPRATCASTGTPSSPSTSGWTSWSPAASRYEPGPAPEVTGGTALCGLQMPIVGALLDDAIDDEILDALSDLESGVYHAPAARQLARHPRPSARRGRRTGSTRASRRPASATPRPSGAARAGRCWRSSTARAT